LCAQFATQSGGLNAVDKGSLPVDLDDGKPFSVGGLELRITRDVDLGVRNPLAVEHLPSALAEVAALGEVEDDPRDRYRA
jgi:hypothetical protein